MPSSCRARMTRTATSPRFAIRTRLNIRRGPLERVERAGDRRLEIEENLPELDGLAVLDMDRAHGAFDLRFDLVHQLHGFEDAQGLAGRDGIAFLDERRGARL